MKPWCVRWLLLGLFWIAIFFAKAAMVRLYGNSLPFGDQWEGEMGFVARFRAGELKWADLFAAHNEHRIALPRLIWLALHGLNEWQMDNLADLYVMAWIAAASATLLMGTILWLTQWQRWMTVLCAGALLAGLPLSWENMLWGFQLGFHLQILLAITAIVGLTLRPFLSAGWWVGLMALAGGLFTSATGFVAAAPLLLHVFLRWYDSRRLTGKEVSNATIAFLTIAAGLALKVEVPHHQSLKAASGIDFVTALAKHFAWPFTTDFVPNSFYWGWVIYIPLLSLGVMLLLGKIPKEKVKEAEFLLGLFSYCILQYAAIAYARGANGLGPPPRNFDFHVLGLATAVAGLSLCWRLASRLQPAMPQRLARASCGLIGAVMLVGVVLNMAYTFGFWLPRHGEVAGIRARLIRHFLVHGDPTIFHGRRRLEELPDPDVKKNAKHLSNPAILDLLPAAARLPASFIPNTKDSGFDNDVELPESFSRRGRPPNPFVSSYSTEGREGSYLSPEFSVNRSHAIFWYAGFETSKSLGISFATEGEHAQAINISSAQKNGRVYWRPVAVRVPDSRFRIKAYDKRPKGWMAFTAPVEAGRLSAWLTHLRPLILPAFWVANGLFVAGVVGIYVAGVRLESQSEGCS